MFYLFVALSVLGYALQGTLLVAYSRRIDSLSLTVYRNLSLVVTMLPLLLFSSASDIPTLAGKMHWVALTGLVGTSGLALMYYSFRFLFVGISSSLVQGSGILASILFGMLFFGETISLLQFMAILVLLGGVFILGISRNPQSNLGSNSWLGILLALVAGILMSFSLFLMGKLAREVSPATAGYFLEASGGFFSVVLLACRRFITGKGIDAISLGTFFRIARASSPTLIGTGAAAWAITLGPFGMMRAYSTIGVLVMIAISYLMYKEKLTVMQWLGVIVTISAIIGIRLG